MPTSTTTPCRLTRLTWAVRGALTLGVAASVAANVLHAQHSAVGRVIAAWPPLALLLTVELISHVPASRRWLAAVRILATVTVAGIAAWVSYWHMATVAARYGETSTSAHLVPLSVDGLVVIASTCLVELSTMRPDAETSADTVPDSPADVAAPPAAELAAPADTVAGNGHAPVKAGELAAGLSTGERIAAAWTAARAANPRATQAEVAALAGVSPRTVRRYPIPTTS
jgi:hypothetical protein